MAQHELNIRADIDTTRVQRKLDSLNNANKAGAGNAGNATDVNVVLRNLQHSLDALNRTLQSLVKGAVSNNFSDASGRSQNTVLTDAILFKRIGGISANNRDTFYDKQIHNVLRNAFLDIEAAGGNQFDVDRIMRRDVRKSYAIMFNRFLGADTVLGRPMKGNDILLAQRYGFLPDFLGDYYMNSKWTSDAQHSWRNIPGTAYNAVQWSRGVGRANPWVGAGIGFAGHATGMLGHSLATAGYEDAGQKLHSASSIAMMGAAGWTLGGPLGVGIGIAVGAISELAAAAGRASKELNQIRASGAGAQFDAGQAWEKWAVQFMTPEQLIEKRDSLKSTQKSLYQNLGAISRELDTLDPVKDRDRYTQLTSMADQIMKQDLPNVGAMLAAYTSEAEKRPTAAAINEEMANKSHEEFVNELLQKYDEAASLIQQREEALLELEQAMKVQGVDILDSMSKQGKWMSDFAMGSTSNTMFSPVTQKMDNIINKLEHLNSIDQEIKRLDMGLK